MLALNKYKILYKLVKKTPAATAIDLICVLEEGGKFSQLISS